MERTSLWIITFISLLILCFNIASAIECYSCNSHVDNDCGCGSDAALSKRHLMQCDSNATLCRKIDIDVGFKSATNDMGPDKRCVRQCGHDQTDESPSYYSAGYGASENAWMCVGDGCNAASSLTGSYILLLFPAVLCLAIFSNSY